MSVYQRNPNQRPDDEFEPGTIAHLVEGNTGRLLDPRRTPITVVGIDVATGIFTVRLEDFEDAGGLWHVPLEKADSYQFDLGIARAPDHRVAQYQQAIVRFNRPLHIGIDPAQTTATTVRLDTATVEAVQWLRAHSAFQKNHRTLPDPQARLGDPLLQDDLQRYMQEHDLLDIEQTVAETYVRNPNSGEVIKGHRIVLADLGLVPFNGTIVRDPATFEGAWDKRRRIEHILRRLGFVRAVFSALAIVELMLFRGCYSEFGQLRPPDNRTFVSTTTNVDVARSHFNAETTLNAALFRQWVPVERVFMSYYETAAMNQHFLEAEVVLLHEPGNVMF